jgi:hypothetical protein
MLDKQGIMFFVVTNVEMNIFYNFQFVSTNNEKWISPVTNMHHYGNLSILPMHALYLVLHLERIIFCKIYMKALHI